MIPHSRRTLVDRLQMCHRYRGQHKCFDGAESHEPLPGLGSGWSGGLPDGAEGQSLGSLAQALGRQSPTALRLLVGSRRGVHGCGRRVRGPRSQGESSVTLETTMHLFKQQAKVEEVSRITRRVACHGLRVLWLTRAYTCSTCPAQAVPAQSARHADRV